MNNLKQDNEKHLFDELGLEVAQGEVTIGNTYPLFGMITQIETDDCGAVIAEINSHIVAKINITDRDRLRVIRERAFETAIFVSTVTALEPKLEVECKAIIFGKRQSYNA